MDVEGEFDIFKYIFFYPSFPFFVLFHLSLMSYGTSLTARLDKCGKY